MTYDAHKKANESEVKIIHTIPKMTETEREGIKRRISSDLYEIFTQVLKELKTDNGH